MQLFYAPDITPPHHTLDEESSRHCVRVLRLGPGGEVWLTDGRGNMHRAEITDADSRQCRLRIVETIHEYGKRDYRLTVAVAPTKNAERYEWFLEKATETGVDRIIPIECDRSERRTSKHERGMRVITSAVKQSLKAYHPTLDEITPAGEVIAAPTGGIKLIAHCREDAGGVPRRFIGDVLEAGREVTILIGPEGDFSAEEVDAALRAGFIAVSLGRERLRTETAALAAATIVSFINGGCGKF